MGGSAFLIYGTPESRLLEPRPRARSLSDRLFNRHPTDAVSEVPLGRDRVLLTAHAGPLDALRREFRSFVEKSLAPPWPSTSAVLDYLALDVTSVYVRGERAGQDAPRWYIQLSFSGCAGMCQTSSSVACHWAERWFARERLDLIARHLAPAGFTADETTSDGLRFVPLGRAGYALVLPAADQGESDADSSGCFEIDTSVVEALGTNSGLLSELDTALGDEIESSRCYCQMCAPELDRWRFDQLAVVRAFSGAH